ncbi:hypothetical protein NE675_12110, partial [Megasphaera massiliensis]
EGEAGHFYGCRFCVLVLEIAFTEPDLAKAFLQGVEKIRALFQKVLRRSGSAEGQAESAARFLMTAYEAYLLQYR